VWGGAKVPKKPERKNLSEGKDPLSSRVSLSTYRHDCASEKNYQKKDSHPAKRKSGAWGLREVKAHGKK